VHLRTALRVDFSPTKMSPPYGAGGRACARLEQAVSGRGGRRVISIFGSPRVNGSCAFAAARSRGPPARRSWQVKAGIAAGPIVLCLHSDHVHSD
jgi:hypothetical protein